MSILYKMLSSTICDKELSKYWVCHGNDYSSSHLILRSNYTVAIDNTCKVY